MYEYAWYQWMAFFFIYCILGWIFESSYVSVKSGRLVNRGFLRLPMLPLYGTGAVMMLWVSLPLQHNLPLVYIAGVIASTLLEYVTGWGMERLFKMRYWDYSRKPCNLNGYICLSSSVAWGFLTLLLTEVIHKPIELRVLLIQPSALIPCVLASAVLFAADTIQSVRTALDLAKVLDAMTRIRAELDDIQVQMSLLRAEAGQRVEEVKDGAILRLELIKAEAAAKSASIKENAMARLTDLAVRGSSLAETRKLLTSRMSYYRKSILRGNPSASSSRFSEALKELKELAKSKRS